MNKPDRAAALRLPPRGPARVPPGARELPRLRAQGHHSERDAAAGAAWLHAPHVIGAAAALPELRGEGQGLARGHVSVAGLIFDADEVRMIRGRPIFA
jgi:hypothetical protein